MAKNGNVILVGLNGLNNIIGSAKSCELNINGETVEISTAKEQVARTYIPGRMTWEITLSYLVKSFTSIQSASGTPLDSILSVGKSYTIYIGERNGNAIESDYISGNAILTRLRITATNGNLIQGSISFTGNGSLT